MVVREGKDWLTALKLCLSGLSHTGVWWSKAKLRTWLPLRKLGPSLPFSLYLLFLFHRVAYQRPKRVQGGHSKAPALLMSHTLALVSGIFTTWEWWGLNVDWILGWKWSEQVFWPSWLPDHLSHPTIYRFFCGVLVGSEVLAVVTVWCHCAVSISSSRTYTFFEDFSGKDGQDPKEFEHLWILWPKAIQISY